MVFSAIQFVGDVMIFDFSSKLFRFGILCIYMIFLYFIICALFANDSGKSLLLDSLIVLTAFTFFRKMLSLNVKQIDVMEKSFIVYMYKGTVEYKIKYISKISAYKPGLFLGGRISFKYTNKKVHLLFNIQPWELHKYKQFDSFVEYLNNCIQKY